MRTLKIKTLPSHRTWIDADHVMLHACFQILEDCMVNEKVDEHVNYEANKEFVDEVRFLYNWWVERTAKEIDDLLEKDQDKEDSEMLDRLMKIRTQLWT